MADKNKDSAGVKPGCLAGQTNIHSVFVWMIQHGRNSKHSERRALMLANMVCLMH